MTAFWRGRRVLVTGHTGFKGAWLALWLERLGAQVTGLGLPPENELGAYSALRLGAPEHLVDLRDQAAVRTTVRQCEPEVVIHLAAQALVRRSYREPVETWATNVLGTGHLLEAVGSSSTASAVVVVTSDKVYRNLGTGRPFTEDDPLGQADPYSSSKAAAELLVESFRALECFRGKGLATARAGNVIGGGDEAEDRLVPDCFRAVRSGRPLEVRFPEAVRPWQHVLEPLHGYLLLAEALATGDSAAPAAVNLGPQLTDCRPVREVVDTVFGLLGEGTWETREGARAEAGLLTLDASLAKRTLGWRPLLGLPRALQWTVDWERARRSGADMRELASSQIASYEAMLEAAHEPEGTGHT